MPTTITGLSSVTCAEPSISATNIISNYSDTDATSYNTASVSPVANKLYLLTVQNRFAAGTPNTPTVTGAGMTWTQVNTALDVGTAGRRITVFRSLNASPSSGVLTIDLAGQTAGNCGWSLNEFSNIDTSGTNGANAIVQSVTNAASGGTSLTITLAAFSSTSNATFGAFRHSENEDVTPGSGFTQLSEFNSAEAFTLFTEFKSTNDTSVDASWTTGGDDVGIAIELKNSSTNMVWVI